MIIGEERIVPGFRPGRRRGAAVHLSFMKAEKRSLTES